MHTLPIIRVRFTQLSDLDRLIVFVNDFNFEAWRGFGSTTCLGLKCMEILIVATYDPSALSLPIVVVNQYTCVLSDPLISRDVASLSCHGDVVKAGNVVLPYPVPLIILPPDGPQGSRTSVQAVNLVLFYDGPQGPRIRQGGFSFVEDCSSSSE